MNPQLEQARDFFLQGLEHFEGGRLEEARSAFESSLKLAPGRASVLGNLGITLFHLGQAEQALPLLKKATAADPTHVDAWSCLALCHEGMSQWPEMADALEQASVLSPDQPGLWFRKGQCLLRLGRIQGALQAFDRALAVAPDFADAWSARGGLMRELHDLDGAAMCFEKALALGGDAELNRYYLASVRAISSPPAPPRRYVEALFDDYAPDFQAHVVSQLRYQGYERLLRPIIESGRQFETALDLGCGTGLCGPLLRPLAKVLKGADISQAMLAQAHRLGIYHELIHDDIDHYLESGEGSLDLVVAADVFIYVGDLTTLFRAIRRRLAAGGQFAFTVETPAAGDGFQLLPSLRYAHSEAYIRRLALEYGFEVEDIFLAPIRHDQAQAIEGLYVYLS